MPPEPIPRRPARLPSPSHLALNLLPWRYEICSVGKASTTLRIPRHHEPTNHTPRAHGARASVECFLVATRTCPRDKRACNLAKTCVCVCVCVCLFDRAAFFIAAKRVSGARARGCGKPMNGERFTETANNITVRRSNGVDLCEHTWMDKTLSNLFKS